MAVIVALGSGAFGPPFATTVERNGEVGIVGPSVLAGDVAK